MIILQCMGLDLSQKKTPTSRGLFVSAGYLINYTTRLRARLSVAEPSFACR